MWKRLAARTGDTIVKNHANKKRHDLSIARDGEGELLGKRHDYGDKAQSTLSDIARAIGFSSAEITELQRVYGGVARTEIGVPANQPKPDDATSSTKITTVPEHSAVCPHKKSIGSNTPFGDSPNGRNQS